VQIALPQQYMVTAIDVMRIDYRDVLERELAGDLRRFARASAAVDRLLDIELAIMLHTFRVDSEERLRRRERLATVGQIAASIGHDLRNPLGVIESSVYLLRKRATGDEAAMRHVEKIAKQVATCGAIVADLLDLAREQPLKIARIEVQSAYAEAVAAVTVPADVRVVYDVPAGLAFEADPGLLQRALVNVVQNAVGALEGRDGTITMTARAEPERVVMSVSDNGPGFDPAVLSHVFEPLVTTRTKGTGLGLALVKGVLERHGGEALADNVEGGGARVTLVFPATPIKK
jgi:signal transduction histidine kinase